MEEKTLKELYQRQWAELKQKRETALNLYIANYVTEKEKTTSSMSVRPSSPTGILKQRKRSTYDESLLAILFRMACETGALIPPLCTYARLFQGSEFNESIAEDESAGVLPMVLYFQVEIGKLSQAIPSSEEAARMNMKSQEELQSIKRIYTALSSKYEAVFKLCLAGKQLKKSDRHRLPALCVLLFLTEVRLFYVKRTMNSSEQSSSYDESLSMWQVMCTLLPAPVLNVEEQTSRLIRFLLSELHWLESAILAFRDSMNNEWQITVEELLKVVPSFHSILNSFQARFDSGLRSRKEHHALSYVASLVVNMTLIARRGVAMVCLRNNKPEIQAIKVAKVCHYWTRRLFVQCWEMGASVADVEYCRNVAFGTYEDLDAIDPSYAVAEASSLSQTEKVGSEVDKTRSVECSTRYAEFENVVAHKSQLIAHLPLKALESGENFDALLATIVNMIEQGNHLKKKWSSDSLVAQAKKTLLNFFNMTFSLDNLLTNVVPTLLTIIDSCSCDEQRQAVFAWMAGYFLRSGKLYYSDFDKTNSLVSAVLAIAQHDNYFFLVIMYRLYNYCPLFLPLFKDAATAVEEKGKEPTLLVSFFTSLLSSSLPSACNDENESSVSNNFRLSILWYFFRNLISMKFLNSQLWTKFTLSVIRSCGDILKVRIGQEFYMFLTHFMQEFSVEDEAIGGSLLLALQNCVR
ncbi:Protein C14C6.3 [Trichuris trichiura]|uniref:Protein C14C6.3 n=1 Tax=Trichuris trichiura TaxID=36087 RepID=A0A077ZB93_TRITR|nr:Protein C14C6.3 [Trichuris trichiura]